MAKRLVRTIEDRDRNERLAAFQGLFAGSDETRLSILSGLIEEAFDCKEEIVDLKERIANMRDRKVKYAYVAPLEKLLNQKRASYTNMMAKLCKNLCTTDTAEEFEGLEDYE